MPTALLLQQQLSQQLSQQNQQVPVHQGGPELNIRSFSTLQEGTHNARGMTWAHPWDFFPELSPLPVEEANSKPFSVGCLAAGPSHLGWSEMVQVRTGGA